jgi:hypothetical protein
MRVRGIIFIIGALWVGALPSCGGSDGTTIPEGPAPTPTATTTTTTTATQPTATSTTPQPELPTVQFLTFRSARWPAGGREFTIGVLDGKTRKPLAEDLSARINVTPKDGVTLSAAPRTLAIGYTAILLPPAVPKPDRATLAKAIEDFAVARKGEFIALYRHGAQVQLATDYLKDRFELTEALARWRDGTDDATPISLGNAVSSVVSDVKDIGGDGRDFMRSVVVLAGNPSVVGVLDTDAFVTGAVPTAAGLTAAGAAIDEVRAKAFYRVSACAKPEKFDATFAVTNLKGDVKATFSATLPEETAGTCDVTKIDLAKRTYTPKIEFVFNDAQRATYAARVAAANATPLDEVAAKADFPVQLRLAPGQPVLLASAHIRGNSTIRCERKSYVIQIPGPSRYLLPDAASDEYMLISMCDDRAYVYGSTAFDLFSDDMWPLKHRYVEVVLDGQTKGIYRLMEKTREGLMDHHARVSALMRRDYPIGPNDVYEVDYPQAPADATAALKRWTDFETAIQPLTGAPLVAALKEKLDLDQYARYLANQTILQCGDYPDELYFLGTEQANGKGQVAETYRIAPWDPEGYSACHAGGANAWPDPWSLAYCAEARLDFKILPDPTVYALFVANIEAQLNGAFSQGKMSDALNKTKAALQAMLVDPALCAANIEFKTINAGYADCAVSRTIVANRADQLLAAYNARRTLLLNNIAAYKAK